MLLIIVDIKMLYISVYVVKLLNRDTACQVLYLVTLILSGFLKDVELCFYSAKGSFRNSCLHRRHSSPKRNKGTKFRKILRRRFYYELHLRQSQYVLSAKIFCHIAYNSLTKSYDCAMKISLLMQ